MHYLIKDLVFMREKRPCVVVLLAKQHSAEKIQCFSILTQVDGKVQSLSHLPVTLSIFDEVLSQITVKNCFFSAFS